MKCSHIKMKLNPTTRLIRFLSSMYSLVYFPVVVFDESLSAVAAEESELFVVLSLMSVTVTLQVESFT